MLWQEAAATRLVGLTARERQIMELVLAGHPSKNIAADLGIGQRTVENHRAAVMNVLPIIESIRASGISSYLGIAEARNSPGIRTARGGRWHATTVRNLISRSR